MTGDPANNINESGWLIMENDLSLSSLFEDGFLDEENWDFRNFRNKYRVATNSTPGTYNLIGYDCMRFMLKPFEKGNIILTREDFITGLKQVGRFEGLYRKIQLDDQNRNTALRILRFNYGQIIPLN